MTTTRPARPVRKPAGPARARSSATKKPARKTVAKPIAARTTAASKTVAKKRIAKKTAVKKTTAKKTVVKKTVAKNAIAVTPRTVARKTATPAARTAVSATPAVDPAERAGPTAVDRRLYRQRQQRVRAAALKRKQTLASHAAGEADASCEKSRRPRATHKLPRSAVHRLDDPPPASGLPLIDRVGDLIEKELTMVEQVVAGGRIQKNLRSEAERRARTLASLTRTLTELRKLRGEQDSKTSDDDAVPRDLDEFRRALSRRLEQLVTGAAECPAAGDE